MALIEALRRILENPSTAVEACREMMVTMVVLVGPAWIAFMVGLMIGWAWKPKWVSLKSDKLSCCVSKFLDYSSSLPSSPCRSLMSPLKGFTSAPGFHFNSLLAGLPKYEHWIGDGNPVDNNKPTSITSTEYEEDCSTSQVSEEEQSNAASLLTTEDLEHLYQLVEVKDGGPHWTKMMDRSTPTMSYQAWRRDPKTGPPQYRSKTVFEDASPELVRDFFWDDEFRTKWDDMLAYSAIIDECPTTGAMLVHWIRKFPFFCSDREYIIGRRIWESGRSYYCVTKGVPSSIPRRDRPKRVDLYFSSWFIRAVESRRGDDQLTSCEVLLFHYEDMGIPWEIAKLGVRQGMWGLVKKIEPGLRAYQQARASASSLSRHAFMARINTKINPEFLRSLGGDIDDLTETGVATTSDRPVGRNIPKLLIIGGAVALVCSIDRGLLTKTFVFGVVRKFANMGKRCELST